MAKVETKECMWVEFDSSGKDQNCIWEHDGYPEKADTEEGKRHCALCMKGMQVTAINSMSNILWKWAEKEGYDK